MLLPRQANLFPRKTRRLQGDCAGGRATAVDRHWGLGERRGSPSRVIEGRAKFVALTDELLHALSQTSGALLDIWPEGIAPEGVFADGCLESVQPALEARASACELRGDSDESDCRLRVQHMLNDASRAAGCKVPVVFFGEDAVQPGEGAAGFTAECAFGFSAFLAREGAGCDALGLVVD